jgi:hypothetical protein
VSYRIDYYLGDKKVAVAIAPPVIDDAVKAARDGLALHNARYAHVVDLLKTGKVVELVHCDVRP